MRTFYILLDGRPKVIGKLRSFYYYMNFRVKAAHSVGCTYDIIFGNRRTEYTGVTKLLLHSFRHIEYTAFFLIRHVLSPNKSIGIVTEFGFQCFINGVDHEGLFAFCLMRTVFVLLRLIRFGHYEIVDAFWVRFGSSQSLPVGSGQFFFGYRFYLLQFFFSQTLIAKQHPAEFHQRVSFLYVFQFVFIPVEGMLVRIGMRTDTDTIRLYNHRITGTDGIFAGFGHGVHRIEYIFAIAIDDFQVLEAGEVFRYLAVGGLFRFGDRNTVTIILNHKNHRKAFETGAVDSFVDKSFGSGRFSVRSDSHSFMSVIDHRSGYACCMKVMCSRCGRYIFDVPFRLREMVRHMATTASGVCRFGNTVQDNLFRSHSGGEYSQHIPVVGKQEVFSESKDLPDRQLDTIMPRIGCMIRPT